jgi:hypothetical protein
MLIVPLQGLQYMRYERAKLKPRRVAVEWLALLPPRDHNPARKRAILTEGLRGFLQSFQENVLNQATTASLHSFPIHYSLTILSFDAA